MGVLALGDALKLARERGLELIQVTEKVDPPVCKIMDYGKFFYQQKKKDKSQKNKGGEMKGIRLSLGISEHDMEVKANQTHKFLDEGDKIRVEMILRGREKSLQGFAREKFKKFLEILNKTSAIKIEREVKREPRGLSMIIGKEAIKK
jgi:translation initiation factor IF-3